MVMSGILISTNVKWSSGWAPPGASSGWARATWQPTAPPRWIYPVPQLQPIPVLGMSVAVSNSRKMVLEPASVSAAPVRISTASAARTGCAMTRPNSGDSMPPAARATAAFGMGPCAMPVISDGPNLPPPAAGLMAAAAKAGTGGSAHRRRCFSTSD